MEYSKKDIKKSPKAKSEIWEEDGMFYFEWKDLGKQGFVTEENAKIALERVKSEK